LIWELYMQRTKIEAVFKFFRLWIDFIERWQKSSKFEV
jgi:hypothetical protein